LAGLNGTAEAVPYPKPIYETSYGSFRFAQDDSLDLSHKLVEHHTRKEQRYI